MIEIQTTIVSHVNILHSLIKLPRNTKMFQQTQCLANFGSFIVLQRRKTLGINVRVYHTKEYGPIIILGPKATTLHLNPTTTLKTTY